MNHNRILFTRQLELIKGLRLNPFPVSDFSYEQYGLSAHLSARPLRPVRPVRLCRTPERFPCGNRSTELLRGFHSETDLPNSRGDVPSDVDPLSFRKDLHLGPFWPPGWCHAPKGEGHGVLLGLIVPYPTEPKPVWRFPAVPWLPHTGYRPFP